MHSLLFPTSCSLFPARGERFNKNSVRFNRNSVLFDEEFADGAQLFASRRELVCSSVSSIRPEGNRRGRPPRRNTASDKAANEVKDQKAPEPSDGETSDPSNQEEIIALFRRIQSSISKGGSLDTKKTRLDNSKEKQSADSVLDVLRQYPPKKLVRGASEGENKVLQAESFLRRASYKKEKKIEQDSQTYKKEKKTEQDSQRGNFKLLRPASNFVKRSPIPSPSTPKQKVVQVLGEGLQAPTEIMENGSQLQRVEEMKLLELKELARSKGVKGYSKLKKGELVELLKGLLQS